MGTKCSGAFVSIPFRADTGFEHYGKFAGYPGKRNVSIPFRADTGFEHVTREIDGVYQLMFQSLSGLTLGLNQKSPAPADDFSNVVSIPFRADTGFELISGVHSLARQNCFNPFQG